MAEWTTRLYETADGERIVEEEIKSLGPEGATKIIRAAKRLRGEGLDLGSPLVKQVEGHIWELRPDRFRVLYFAHTGRQFVLLRAFLKKSQRTPKREMETAKRRMDDYQARYQGGSNG